MQLFVLSACRAIVEMLGYCLLGQGLLFFLAGEQRHRNPIYQLFALITKPPRTLVGAVLPKGTRPRTATVLTFVALLILWISLSILRKFI
ncbi:MAG: hypothetical protein L6Q40_03695 [Azonexus sp.]|nr:hypothetical protein [Azonexus sp.]